MSEKNKVVDIGNILSDMAENVNTKEHWDAEYKGERRKARETLTYPEKFEIIASEVGSFTICNEGRVLELGSGLGILLETIRRRYPDLILKGVDISEEAVKILRGKGFFAEVVKLPNLREPVNYYDVVICCETIEHLGYEARAETLAQLWKVLKVGGVAIITVPNDCLKPEFVAEHKVAFTRSSFEAYLKLMDWNDVRVEELSHRASHIDELNVEANLPYLKGVCIK